MGTETFFSGSAIPIPILYLFSYAILFPIPILHSLPDHLPIPNPILSFLHDPETDLIAEKSSRSSPSLHQPTIVRYTKDTTKSFRRSLGIPTGYYFYNCLY